MKFCSFDFDFFQYQNPMKDLKTLILLLFCSLIYNVTEVYPQISEDLYQTARQIHSRIVTLDSHTDTPLMLGRRGIDLGKRNPTLHNGSRVDFKRMQEGGLDAVFFAVFLGQGPLGPEAYTTANQNALNIFNDIFKALESHKDLAGLAVKADDALRFKAEGKRAVYIGLENAYPIGEDISLVKSYYDLGMRYITICHSLNNQFCDSSTDEKGAVHNGLSVLGEQLILEMEKLGIMIDISHVSDATFYDVIEIAHTPVIASHSNARAICNHPRNLDDDMLRALAENGGVVQVCVLSDYVKEMPVNPARENAFKALREKYHHFQGLSETEMEEARAAWYALDQQYPDTFATVRDLVDHIDHIVNLIGIEHVGIGTDFDGGGGLEDCLDVSQMINITVELLRRGYSEPDIEKIWSGNFLRVFRQVEAYANRAKPLDE